MAKRIVKRSPWAKLARAIQEISPSLSAKEVDLQAWTIWFNQACPLANGAISKSEDADACLAELYEQSAGKFVDDEDDDEEETPKE